MCIFIYFLVLALAMQNSYFLTVTGRDCMEISVQGGQTVFVISLILQEICSQDGAQFMFPGKWIQFQ